MKAEMLDKVIEAGSAAVQAGVGVHRMKEAVTEALEDGINSAKRASRRGRRAVEDLVDDARYELKQRPFGTAGISFAVGTALGTVAGILLTRNGRCSR